MDFLYHEQIQTATRNLMSLKVEFSFGVMKKTKRRRKDEQIDQD